MKEINLQQIVDLDVLQNIQDEFSNATGLSAITVDFRGIPMTRYSNFTPFCKLIRKNKIYRERCYRCDAYGGVEATRRKDPYIYRCHTGLADFAIPIKIQGQFIGSVLAGQAKLDESEQPQLQKIIPEKTNWEEDKILVEAYENLPITSLQKVVSGAKLLQTLISNLIEKDIIKYVQDELNNKNMKLAEQLKDQEELRKELQENELSIIQPQIDIGFLENSINTASRLSILEKANKTTEVLYDVTDMIQYTVLNANRLVKLEEELAHIKRYLNLQTLRFGNRFQYEIDVAQVLMNEKIPSLILQAVVDNALVHGLEMKEENGLLRIHADVVEANFVIKIIDNGVGIPVDILEQIELDKMNKNTSNTLQTTGIDLSTIKKILKKYYGDHYKMKITSQLHKGTTVMIMLPMDSR